MRTEPADVAGVVEPTASDVVRVATDLYAALARGDMPAVLALFDPAIEFREAEGNPYHPDGSPWIGPQTVLTELFARLPEEWDGFAVHPQSLTPTTDGVVMQGRYSGTYKATGRSIDVQVCHVLRVRDGRVTHFQQYIDTSTLQWAMGVTPQR